MTELGTGLEKSFSNHWLRVRYRLSNGAKLMKEGQMNYRWMFVAVLLLSGCATTDPGAVRSFAAMAPDATKLHTLTAAYADAPEQLASLDVLHLTAMTNDQISRQVQIRNRQIAEIDALHAVLVNYMKSLGALANNSLVQTSGDAKDVTDGLNALSKTSPGLGLTSGMITSVGSIITLLGNSATAGYRQEQLTKIIGKSEAPFQQLIKAERTIVSEGVIKELQNVRGRTLKLAEVTHALTVNLDAESKESRPPGENDTGVNGLNPKLQRSGAADVASLYLLQRSIRSDLATLDLQIDAAKAYVTALNDIAAAHTVLYNNRDNLLSEDGARTAITQITPILKNAITALQTLKNM